MLYNKVRDARYKTAIFLSFLYLQEIFWFIISRLSFDDHYLFNKIQPIDLLSVFLFLVLCVFFSMVSVFFSLMNRPLHKLQVRPIIIFVLICMAIFFNFLSVVFISSNARYVEGGLTGISGLVYGLRLSFSLLAFVLFFRDKKGNNFLSTRIFYIFTISFVLTIDGLASAMTLFMFFVIMFMDDVKIKLKNILKLGFIVLLGMVLAYIGFEKKFNVIPDYLNFNFIVHWLISRFSIQAEQAYTYLSGSSIIGKEIEYTEILIKTFQNRIDVILGDKIDIYYPRSLSEAIFYDMKGQYGAGSSPGLLLSTILLGPFFFIPPMILSIIFFNFFYGLNFRLGFSVLVALSFVFKALFSNISEYFVFVSPSILTLFMFFVGCMIMPSGKLK